MLKRGVRNLIVWFERHKKISILIVLASIVIAVYPRFNRHDIAIIRPFVGLKAGEVSPDIKNYVNFTEYFKGKLPLDSTSVPYSYRPLVPFLASLLPTDSLLGIVIINIAALLLSVLSIFFILKKEHFSFGLRTIGCLLYIFSFPVFYYVSAGYIDSSALCIICLVVLAAVYKKYLALPVIFLVGALVKEVIIIALPFALIYYYQQREKKSEDVKIVFTVILSITFFLVAYYYSRATFAVVSNFMWLPGLSSIQQNIFRAKTYLSFTLSFGVVGILAVMQIIADFKEFTSSGKHSINIFLKEYPSLPYVTGIIASLALYCYSFVAAYADGRFIWTAYPFMIPLAVKFCSKKTGWSKNF
jgi:hypothetical protein